MTPTEPLSLCPLTLVTSALLCGVVIATTLLLRRRPGGERVRCPLPPGPRGWGALCSLVDAIRRENLHIAAERWSGEYGDLVLCSSPAVWLCFLNRGRLARAVLGDRKLQPLTSHRPDTFTGWLVFNNHRNLITADSRRGSEWTLMRKLLHRAIKFYGDGVDHMESLLHTELQRLVTELHDSRGKDVDVDEKMSNSLLCVITSLVSGERLEPGCSLFHWIRRYNDLLNAMFNPVNDLTLAMFPWLRFLPFTSYWNKCRDVIRAKNEVFARLFDPAKATHQPGDPRGIVDVLLDEQAKGDNSWLTDDHVKGLLTNVIGAAYTTSVQTLKAAILYLTHFPDIQRRIQAEIQQHIGKRTPGLEDRGSLPYTEAVILETLRFSSIAPLGIAHETSGDVTVDGRTIPEGAMVFANPWVFHRDPEIFPDPDKFCPSRFLDDQGHLLPANHPSRQSLLPFGVGTRACPGEAFAKSRVFLYVTVLLQTFDLVPPTDHALIPPDQSSWINSIVLELRPYHVIFRSKTSPDQ